MAARANVPLTDVETGEVVARFVYVEDAKVAAQAMANSFGRTLRVETRDNDLHFEPAS